MKPWFYDYPIILYLWMLYCTTPHYALLQSATLLLHYNLPLLPLFTPHHCYCTIHTSWSLTSTTLITLLATAYTSLLLLHYLLTLYCFHLFTIPYLTYHYYHYYSITAYPSPTYCTIPLTSLTSLTPITPLLVLLHYSTHLYPTYLLCLMIFIYCDSYMKD